MVANVSSTAVTPNPKVSVSSRAPSPAKPKRAPLIPSEADNNAPSNSLPRRPKSRDVSSRYMSSTASSATSSSSSSSSNSVSTPRRRFPSPLVSSTNLMTPATKTMMNSKRALSTERRRPVTPRIGEMTAAAKMLTAATPRNLSVSFQGQAVSKVSKSQPTGYINGSRHVTPERGGVTPVTVRKLLNPKPIDQQRWPGRIQQESFMTRSVDFTNENMKLSGSGTVSAVRALQKPNKPDNNNNNNNNRSVDKLCSDSDNSDRVSVSSGNTLVVPSRFRQETVIRLRREHSEPVSPPLSLNNKLPSVNRYLKDGPALSPRGSSRSPVRRAFRPASPNASVLLSSVSSPSRGMPSPTRVRGGLGLNNSNVGNSNTPSILSFAAETRRRKVGDNAIVDAHALRLLHNKYLQWRFANARTDAAMVVQRAVAQKSLYNSWVTTSKIRQSVMSKQIEIQRLRQNLKLYTVLKNQMPYLKVCDQLERDHIVSLSETIVSLESSTLRLPLVDGAKANIQSLKHAIRSAADVMHAMTSLIRSLVTKAEYVNALASELANTTKNERSMLDRCTDLLSMLTHLEVQDCSLRTHVLQLQRLPPTTITEL